MITNYNVINGVLKGASLGGWVRHNTSPCLSALIDGTTNTFTGEHVRNPSRTIMGLNLGYKRKLSQKRTLDFRFAVSNLFDKDDFEPIEADSVSGVITAVRPITPLA